MIKRFEEFISSNKLFEPGEKLLLAVSGGIDSMVMLNLLSELHNNISVAHCNFNLRAEESDMDERFVKAYCDNNHLEVFVRKFQTSYYAEENGISTQMAARELRYNWFEELYQEHHFNYIVLGHNMDDSVETCINNLIRGTGIRGLTGIKAKNGHLLRPLIFAKRSEISEYAKSNNLEFREDSSNRETKYIRNRIRHKILPLMTEINPSVLNSIAETSTYLDDVFQVYNEAILNTRERLLVKDNEYYRVNIEDIRSLKPNRSLIFELFNDFGIGRLQIDEILNLLDAETGKLIITDHFTIFRDRGDLRIMQNRETETSSIIIKSENDLKDSKLFKSLVKIQTDSFEIEKNPSVASIDADQLNYPLVIRSWREGDSFYPIGLSGKKKLSDLFIDLKIPLKSKDDIKVLESSGKIVWVIGIRLDDRFKVHDKTMRMLILETL